MPRTDRRAVEIKIVRGWKGLGRYDKEVPGAQRSDKFADLNDPTKHQGPLSDNLCFVQRKQVYAMINYYAGTADLMPSVTNCCFLNLGIQELYFDDTAMFLARCCRDIDYENRFPATLVMVMTVSFRDFFFFLFF